MRRRYDDCLGCRRYRAVKSIVDARGTIDYHEIEVERERVHDVSETARRNKRTVLNFRRRQNVKRGIVDVLNQRLFQSAFPRYDVKDVVNHLVFDRKHDVKVIKPDIGVHKHDFFACFRNRDSKTCRKRRFADAAFSRCNNNFSSHNLPPHIW